jgi:hypothetical protein
MCHRVGEQNGRGGAARLGCRTRSRVKGGTSDGEQLVQAELKAAVAISVAGGTLKEARKEKKPCSLLSPLPHSAFQKAI